MRRGLLISHILVFFFFLLLSPQPLGTSLSFLSFFSASFSFSLSFLFFSFFLLDGHFFKKKKKSMCHRSIVDLSAKSTIYYCFF